jgi:hypothetical protein
MIRQVLPCLVTALLFAAPVLAENGDALPTAKT